jgi:hypothetical protein
VFENINEFFIEKDNGTRKNRKRCDSHGRRSNRSTSIPPGSVRTGRHNFLFCGDEVGRGTANLTSRSSFFLVHCDKISKIARSTCCLLASLQRRKFFFILNTKTLLGLKDFRCFCWTLLYFLSRIPRTKKKKQKRKTKTKNK